MDEQGARERLDEALAESRTRISALERDVTGLVDAARDTASDDEHDPEGSTLAFERSQSASLLDAAVAEEAELLAASARLDAGTYGRCEVCGGRIAEVRLAARPAARTCIDCARSA